MKNLLSIASILCLGLALSVSACGKDKKTTTDPAKAEPAAAEPAKADPSAAAKPDDKAAEPKAGDKPAGGW